jgi:Domain of unknown function (DUF4198)
MFKKSIGLGGLALLVASTTALGHDYWLAPSAATVAEGGAIELRLYRGEPWDVGDERPLEIDKTERFRLLAHDHDHDQDLLDPARDGRTPIAQLMLKSPGGNLVVMERRPQPNRLAADKFTEYLREEGLDAIVEQRKQLGESEADGREHYGRCLKALIQVGDRRDESYCRVVGHILEIPGGRSHVAAGRRAAARSRPLSGPAASEGADHVSRSGRGQGSHPDRDHRLGRTGDVPDRPKGTLADSPGSHAARGEPQGHRLGELLGRLYVRTLIGSAVAAARLSSVQRLHYRPYGSYSAWRSSCRRP